MTKSTCLRRFPLAALALLVAGSATPFAAAQTRLVGADLAGLEGATHVIIPQARSFALRPRPQNLTVPVGIQIAGVDVRVEMLEQTARTTMDIDLRNTSGRQEEAVLLLPIPDGAVQPCQAGCLLSQRDCCLLPCLA